MTFIEKWNKHKTKIKLIAVLAVEFIAVITILLLVLFAGKKSYTVTFDLNGGTLLGGDVVQRVVQGQNANPPSVAKYGHYLLRWSGSYKSVTRDVTVKAIWEYETSPGIEYYVPENTNYCEISGSYRDIQGDVYIGAYYDGRQVMGIKEAAFKDRVGITSVHLLDGILGIADEAFAGCSSLEVIDIPSTVVRIGEGAFSGCESLREITLPSSLKLIDESAFEGCTSLEKVTFYEVDPVEKEDGSLDRTGEVRSKIETIGSRAFFGCSSLTELTLPASLKSIGESAFEDCSSLETVTFRKVETVKTVDEEADENERHTDNNEGNGENEKTEITVFISNIKFIGARAFYGCESLCEIIIPESVVNIGEFAFNTPEMTIFVYFIEGETPEGFAESWAGDDATVIYDYANYVPEEDVEESEKDDKDKNEGDKDNEDEDDEKGGFWEGLSL